MSSIVTPAAFLQINLSHRLQSRASPEENHTAQGTKKLIFIFRLRIKHSDTRDIGHRALYWAMLNSSLKTRLQNKRVHNKESLMFKKTEKFERNADEDITLLADTLDEVLKSGNSKTKEELEKIRGKAEGVLRDARSRSNGNTNLTQHARDAASQATDYVKENPWHGVGVGAAVGIVLGVLLGRK
jgi:ElaB protein